MTRIVIFTALAQLGFLLWGVADAIGTPGWIWRRARRDKGRWIAAQIALVLIGMPILGTLAYFSVARPSLAVARAMHDAEQQRLMEHSEQPQPRRGYQRPPDEPSIADIDLRQVRR